MLILPGKSTSWTAGSSSRYQSFGVFDYTDVSTTTQDITVDLSAATVGNEILIAYGSGSNVTGLTVNGNAATSVASVTGTSGGNRQDLYKYTLQSGDDASITITATLDSADNNGAFRVVEMLSGTVSVLTDSDFGFGNTQLSVSVTPTQATNTIMVFYAGNSGAASGTVGTPPPTYGSATEIENESPVSGFSACVAVIEDGSTGGVTETIDGSGVGGDRNSALVVVVE